MFFTKEEFALFGENYITEALASNSIYSVSDTEYISAENVSKALASTKIVKVRDTEEEFYLKRDIAFAKKDEEELIIVEGVFLTKNYFFRELDRGNIVECDRCGELFFKENAIVTETGETLCLGHAQRYFKQCEDCGKWFPKSMFREIEGRTICLDCVCRIAYFCDHCRQFHFNSVPSHQVVGNSGVAETWCDTCFNEDAAECAHCHTVVTRNRLDSRNHFCPTCVEAFARPIHRYSYKPAPRFYGNGDMNSTLYFGMELETDNGNNEDFAIALLAGCDIEEEHFEPVKEVYCKADGSLSYQGCEVVCHPCTLDYHLSDNSFWYTVTRLASNYGMKSHDAMRAGEHDCGLHIHVSRKPFEENNVEDYEEKIAVAFEKFRNEWQKVARRRNNHYAQFYGVNEKEALKREMSYSDRYHAVNTQNSSTVEIRIFRGTLNLNTLKATFWAVGNMCERILKGLDTNTVDNFLDLFDMSSAPDYVTAYFTKKKLLPEVTETAEPVEMPMAV